MPRRPVTAYAAVWLVGAVVATGTGLVAVRLVGGAVGDREVAPLSAAAVEQALRDAPGPTALEVAGSPEPSPPPGSPDPPATPSALPDPPTPAASPSARPAVPSPAGEPSPPPAPPATTGAATYRVTGGVLAVGCTGSTARLRYATPSSGWRVEVDVAAGARVEVEFESGDARTRARVTCPGGRPVLDVEDGSSGGPGSDGSGSDGSGGSGGSGGD